jgi:hypothetical protein
MALFNLEKVPFSAPGAYLAVIQDSDLRGGGVWIRTLIRSEWGTMRRIPSDYVFRLIPRGADGVFAAYIVDFEPHKLIFNLAGGSGGGTIEVYFSDWDALVIRGTNATLAIEYGHGDNMVCDVYCTTQRFTAQLPVSLYHMSLDAAAGELTHDGEARRIHVAAGSEGGFALEFRATPVHVPTIAAPFPYKDPASLRDAFEDFCGHYPQDDVLHTRVARYILFTAKYESRGLFKRPCIAATKKGLNLVWNWDNCFASLALAKADPALSWDNILMFFELQKENGQLPDAVNPFISVDWYLKPPVHGIFIEWLLDKGVLPCEKDLHFIYTRLAKWTRFWKENFCNSDGLYFYKHGNDSGWDNATCFDSVPTVTPDLNAYIVLQLYSLSRLANLLGDGPAASRWAAEAQEHIRCMTELLFDADSGAFLCIGPDSKRYKTGSLIRMLPLILGNKLPEHIRRVLANELKTENHYLTARGFATESVKSPLYDQRRGDADHNCAYWRGPIWAPVMVLLTKGLVRCGEAAFAKEAARRFIAAMELEADTFRENYDALLPSGCDDDGFVWTAASYVLLKDEEFYREK